MFLKRKIYPISIRPCAKRRILVSIELKEVDEYYRLLYSVTVHNREAADVNVHLLRKISPFNNIMHRERNTQPFRKKTLIKQKERRSLKQSRKPQVKKEIHNSRIQEIVSPKNLMKNKDNLREK